MNEKMDNLHNGAEFWDSDIRLLLDKMAEIEKTTGQKWHQNIEWLQKIPIDSSLEVNLNLIILYKTNMDHQDLNTVVDLIKGLEKKAEEGQVDKKVRDALDNVRQLFIQLWHDFEKKDDKKDLS